jgi:cellulose synthase/poly-beta-1,6-N-acetylglucosamine synthase-like glycosyltransferase
VTVLEWLLRISSWVALAVFIVVGVTYLGFTVVAWRRLAAFDRARAYLPLDEIFSSPLTPPISVLMPAYNEERGIVPSVNSLVDLRYPNHEVIVVNDGSTDGTLARLREAFDLVPVREALRTRLATAPIHATYVSRSNRNLWVIDKENGGKSDALNAGINAASHNYFCAVDADAVLEEDALLRVVKPVVDAPDLLVAAGGIVRVANGCVIDHGRVTAVHLPRSRLAAIQVVEYFRAFLIGRIGWDSLHALIIISGAFGLFRRQLVEEVGGYATDTVGEDLELVTRLHVHLRERDEEYRITFVPDPVCWTEAPEDLQTLARQRRRWQRGLGETLWRRRGAILNPRYGTVGMLALPYFVFIEFASAAIEALGLFIVLVAFFADAVSLAFLFVFLALSIVLSVVLSVAAIMLDGYAGRQHDRAVDVARLALYAVLENFGYRQLSAFWRCRGIVDLLRGRKDWGAMQRRGLERPAEVPVPPAEKVRG